MTRDEFLPLYAEFLPKVRAYIAARISRPDDAEDLAADVFTKALDALDSYSAYRAEFSTWLYTIASNTIRDYLRRSSVRDRHLVCVDDEVLNSVADGGEELGAGLLRRELLDALAECLEELPLQQRQIVVLQYYDCLPQKEIAQRLGLSYANTRYLSHKAVKALQSAFRSRGLLE